MDLSTEKTTMKSMNKKSASDQLLELARKQNMNTDIRRSIFVIVMSSEVSVYENEII
jgi:predicted CopG family antitoxin